MARIFAGWAMLPGVGGILLALESRWSSWRVVMEAGTVGIAFFLLALPRAWTDLNTSNPLAWGLLVVLIVAIVVLPLFYLIMQMCRPKLAVPDQTTA
jgi:hypothetical protein